jgi:exopolyphosphatase/guanosine-5'-triphosphate,3'-diphosphate pyrophosphatase
MTRIRGILSIGTNSVRALVADLDASPPRILHAASIGTRIGEGLDRTGTLGTEPMRRTIEALREHARVVGAFDAHPAAIATHALRRAANADRFLEEVRGTLGIAVRVISGDEEARASYRGAVSVLGDSLWEQIGVLDIGGGSTEYAYGNDREAKRWISCDIGAVRLTEAFPALAGTAAPVPETVRAAARTRAAAMLAPLATFPPVSLLVAVGGTMTTAVALVHGADGIPPAAEETPTPVRVTKAQLGELIALLCSLDVHERRVLPGMRPQRADIMPAGLMIAEQALEILGGTELLVTEADVLLGYLLLYDEERDTGAARAG